MENPPANKSSGCFISLIEFIGKSLAVFLGLIILALSLEIVFWAMGGLLIVSDPIEPTDAIVALSGEMNG